MMQLKLCPDSFLVPSEKVDGTTTVKAWNNGVAVAMADLGLSKAGLIGQLSHRMTLIDFDSYDDNIQLLVTSMVLDGWFNL